MRSKDQQPPVQARGVNMGFRGTRYKQDFHPEPTINPSSIGYPMNQLELETFSRHQVKRANMTLSAKGNGLLTELDVQRIKNARAKRARQANRQAKGMKA